MYWPRAKGGASKRERCGARKWPGCCGSCERCAAAALVAINCCCAWAPPRRRREAQHVSSRSSCRPKASRSRGRVSISVWTSSSCKRPRRRTVIICCAPIVAHHFFKEFPPLLRTVEDLGQTHLHLPDGPLPIVSAFPILPTQGQGQAAKPLAEHALDVLGPQPVTGLLQLLGVGAGAKAVVQRFEGEALLFQLALRPLMPVQAQLQAPGGVAADLQEDRPEVLIVDVKVVVIDVDRLVAIIVEG